MRVTGSLPVVLFAAVTLLAPTTVQAQRRSQTRAQAVPRPPASRPVYRPVPRSSHGTYYRPYYSRPYYSYPYRTYAGLSFGWGWGYPYSFFAGYGYPFGGYPYGWYPYAWSPHSYEYFVAQENMGAVRIMAKPRQAEVYVDGYYVGLVDDYDGTFQRLRLAPGEHELTLYLDGYTSVRQKLYFTPGATLKVQAVLEPLAAGEPAEPRPEPPANLPGGEAAPAPTPRTGVTVEPGRRMESAYGALAIRVQPAGSEILIDGDSWMAPIDQQSLVVQVTEGVHTVVVRQEGYDTFSAEIEVRRGETTPLNVSLLRRE